MKQKQLLIKDRHFSENKNYQFKFKINCNYKVRTSNGIYNIVLKCSNLIAGYAAKTIEMIQWFMTKEKQ